MGASDWAGKEIQKMQKAFDIEHDRALQFTRIVRYMVSDSEFEELREKTIVGDEEFWEVFIDNLTSSLEEREEEVLEERWNALVHQYGLDEVAGEDVFLENWNHSDEESEGRRWSKRAVFKNQDGDEVTMAEIYYDNSADIAEAKGFEVNRRWDEVERVNLGYLLDGEKYTFTGYDNSIERISDGAPEKNTLEKDQTSSNRGQTSLSDGVDE